MLTSGTDSDSHLVSLSGKKRPLTRLVFLITALACLLVAAFAAWFVAVSRQTQLRDAEVANSNVARMIAVQVESTLKTADVALVNIVERIEQDGIGQEAMDRLRVHLVEVARTSPELSRATTRTANTSPTTAPTRGAHCTSARRSGAVPPGAG